MNSSRFPSGGASVPLLVSALFLGVAAGCTSDAPSNRSPGTSARRPEPALPPVSAEVLARIEARLVRVPAGTLPARKPSANAKRPEAKVDSFWLGKYEVTLQEWIDVMDPDAADHAGERSLPATNVSWGDAHRFVDRLNQAKGAEVFRLPTAAEWEHACRAGEMGRLAAKANEAALGKVAWFSKNSGGRPHPVGSLKPNAFGLFDMIGNVAEWCEDSFSPNGRDLLRVTAGGYFSESVLNTQDCATDGYLAGEYRENYVGFRLAKSAPRPPPTAKSAPTK